MPVLLAAALVLALAPPDEPKSAGRMRFEAFQASMRAGTLDIYPAGAKAKNLPGSALLECVVDEEGYLEDCLVVSEEPKAEGFGAAALKMAPGFRKPDDRGSRIQLPIDFKAAPPDLESLPDLAP